MLNRRVTRPVQPSFKTSRLPYLRRVILIISHRKLTIDHPPASFSPLRCGHVLYRGSKPKGRTRGKNTFLRFSTNTKPTPSLHRPEGHRQIGDGGCTKLPHLEQNAFPPSLSSSAVSRIRARHALANVSSSFPSVYLFTVLHI